MEIGSKIQQLRKQNNLSQEELAEKLDVARQTISKWELGETSPDLAQAKKLSQIFQISLDELTNNDIKDVLINKISNTEKLAGITIKILKWFGVAIILLGLLLIIIFAIRSYFEVKPNNMIADSYGIYCYVNNEKKYYEATIDRDNPIIIKDIKKYIISHDGSCN